VTEKSSGRSEEENLKVEDPQSSCEQLEAVSSSSQHMPALRQRKDTSYGLPVVWLV